MFFIANLNPEILLKAQVDHSYQSLLNVASLKIIDGIGVKLIAELKGTRAGERMAGADLAEIILKKSNQLKLKIGLVLRKDGLSQAAEVKKRLKEKFNNLSEKKILIYEVSQKKRLWRKELSIIDPQIEVLLVGLGAPEQEKFIVAAQLRLPKLRLAMGVGGTFDFWTGKQRRAPQMLRRLGMEWLWRLIKQPQRIRRIWRAVVVFPCRALTAKEKVDAS